MMAQKSQWEKVYLFTNDSLINKRRFEEAYTPCDENLKLAEKEFGKKHPNYAKSTLQLWTILYRINKLKEGISLLTDYLPILQKSRLKDSIYHGQTLNYLGLTHKKNNAKETAESFFLQAKEQCKKDFTLEYANALNNLGSLYYDIGRTDEAIEHLTKALSFASKETPSYFNRLANLGMVYQSKGRFK